LLYFSENSSGFSVSAEVFVDHQRRKKMRDHGELVIHGWEMMWILAEMLLGRRRGIGVME
jgi:hypothetical protein